MKTWAVQDAKARFSEFLMACVQEGPQMVTYRGEEKAILIPVAEWQRLQKVSQPTLKELLLSDTPRFDVIIPPRGAKKRRKPMDF